MALTTLQKRGALTVPQADRATLAWEEGQLLLSTVEPPDTLRLRAIPDSETLFTRYADAERVSPGEAVPATVGAWIPAPALWHAQHDVASPWRPIWQALSRGMQTRRCDPTIVGAWADQMARVFPDRSRTDQADYLQAVCAWPGVELPDRTFWLTVCTVWGQSDQAWSDVVWQVRNAETTPEAIPTGATPVGAAAVTEAP